MQNPYTHSHVRALRSSRAWLAEHPNVLNRFFALDRFQGCFRLEFLVIPCAQGESYASLLLFRKKDS